MPIPPPYSTGNYTSAPMSSQLYPQQYGQSLPSHYSSTFTSGALPTTMTMLPQESNYGYQTPVSNGSYNWSQPTTRSISSETGEDLSSSFHVPYRTNTYPFVERRMTNPIQQGLPTSSSLASMGLESQQNPMHGQFQQPSSYQPLQMGMQQEWGRGSEQSLQVSAPGIGSYPQGWYQQQSSMEEMSSGEGQPQILPSHSHNISRGQRKPG
jgi:hypothetical protein